MGFSRQGYWSGLPFPPPEDLSNPSIESMSPALEGGFFFFTTGATGNPRSTGGSKHFILDGSSSPKRSTAQSEQELTETEISRGVDIDSIKILCSNTEL